MLVLSRKQKQQIHIGDEIVLTVLAIKGGSVRLGIEAPREIHVMRAELNEFREPRLIQKSEAAPVTESQTSEVHTAQTTEAAATGEFSSPSSTRKPLGSRPSRALAIARPEEDDCHTRTEATEEKQDGKVLELRIHGGQDEDVVAPTRLTEIAKSIPSLNLPR